MSWMASLITEGIQVWHPPLGHKSTSLFHLLFPNVTQNVPGGVQAACVFRKKPWKMRVQLGSSEIWHSGLPERNGSWQNRPCC